MYVIENGLYLSACVYVSVGTEKRTNYSGSDMWP
jgi:hypothetical protein